eukprot:scaffold519169_cov18-Prasinocladus_malaysianus.AAC.1
MTDELESKILSLHSATEANILQLVTSVGAKSRTMRNSGLACMDKFFRAAIPKPVALVNGLGS